MTLTKTDLSLIVILTAASLIPACKKSNSASPAMTATIGTISFQSTTATSFHTIIDSVFAFNMEMRHSTDSSYIFLEFRGAFQLNTPIDSYVGSVLFDYGDFGSTFYSAGGFGAAPPASNRGHVVLTITAWDSTAHSIAGTFNGSGFDLPNVTDSVSINGKFNTTYIDN